MGAPGNRPPYPFMKYNDVIDIQVTTDVTTEPVTLADVKRHLNLQFDTSGSYEFNDDDTKLTDLITQCRELIEGYTGLSLGEKTLKVILRNECGDIEIPRGPVNSITSIKDIDGTALVADTDYKVRGNQFKWVESPLSCYLEIVYTAGYKTDNPIPNGLKRAILEEIAFRYTYAGDQQKEYASADVSLCKSAWDLAARYTRKSIIA